MAYELTADEELQQKLQDMQDAEDNPEDNEPAIEDSAVLADNADVDDTQTKLAEYQALKNKLAGGTTIPKGPQGGFRASDYEGKTLLNPSGSPQSNDVIGANQAQIVAPVQQQAAPVANGASFEQYVQKLAELQKLRNSNNTTIGLGEAGSKVAQGISRLSGGVIDDNASAYKPLRENAGQEVKDYESLMKSYRTMSGKGMTTRPTQQSSMFGKDASGQLFPLTYDPNSNTYINGVTGKPISPDTKIIRSTMSNDAFGNKVTLGSDGVEVLSTSTRKDSPESVNTNYENTTSFNPDKVQAKALDSETKRIDTLTQKINEKTDATFRLKSALATNNKLTGSLVRTQMPRLSGEVGNLSETEQAAWAGSKALLDRIDQYLTGVGDSTITPENKAQLIEMIDIFEKTAVGARDSIMDSSATRLNMVHHIPKEFVKKSYGDPRSYASNPSAKKVLKTEVSNKGRTRITYTDGSVEIK